MSRLSPDESRNCQQTHSLSWVIIFNMYSKDIFKTNLKKLRDEKHWSQAELSAHVGLSIKQISRLENGGSFPNDTTLDRLSEAFSVPVSTFFLDPSDSLAALGESSLFDIVRKISTFYASISSEVTKKVHGDMNNLYREGKFDRFAFEELFSPAAAPVIISTLKNSSDENLKTLIKSAIKEMVKDSILKNEGSDTN